MSFLWQSLVYSTSRHIGEHSSLMVDRWILNREVLDLNPSSAELCPRARLGSS